MPDSHPAPPEVTLYVCATGACDVVRLRPDACRCRTTPRPGIVAYGSLVPVEYVPVPSSSSHDLPEAHTAARARELRAQAVRSSSVEQAVEAVAGRLRDLDEEQGWTVPMWALQQWAQAAVEAALPFLSSPENDEGGDAQ